LPAGGRYATLVARFCPAPAAAAGGGLRTSDRGIRAMIAPRPPGFASPQGIATGGLRANKAATMAAWPQRWRGWKLASAMAVGRIDSDPC